jgi:hypothetical protein
MEDMPLTEAVTRFDVEVEHPSVSASTSNSHSASNLDLATEVGGTGRS